MSIDLKCYIDFENVHNLTIMIAPVPEKALLETPCIYFCSLYQARVIRYKPAQQTTPFQLIINKCCDY